MTIDQINSKYAQLCQEIGDAYFQMEQFKISIDFKIKEAKKLNELAKLLNESTKPPNISNISEALEKPSK